ncbi:hypothetical protein J2T20_000402 [Paenibacillus wynnii]|nr:hypothetical protein [Paenibacillus wynnii]
MAPIESSAAAAGLKSPRVAGQHAVVAATPYFPLTTLDSELPDLYKKTEVIAPK